MTIICIVQVYVITTPKTRRRYIHIRRKLSPRFPRGTDYNMKILLGIPSQSSSCLSLPIPYYQFRTDWLWNQINQKLLKLINKVTRYAIYFDTHFLIHRVKYFTINEEWLRIKPMAFVTLTFDIIYTLTLPALSPF